MSKKSTKDSVTNTSVRAAIEEQTAAFLKAGGAIQQIDKGKSGQLGPTGSKPSNVKKG